MKVRLKKTGCAYVTFGREFLVPSTIYEAVESHIPGEKDIYSIRYGLGALDWFTLTKQQLIEQYDVVDQIPRRKSGETPDEIAEWFGYHCSDPIAGMADEIYTLASALHDLRNSLAGKIGSAQAIVELSRAHQQKIETLSKAFNMGEGE